MPQILLDFKQVLKHLRQQYWKVAKKSLKKPFTSLTPIRHAFGCWPTSSSCRQEKAKKEGQ